MSSSRSGFHPKWIKSRTERRCFSNQSQLVSFASCPVADRFEAGRGPASWC